MCNKIIFEQIRVNFSLSKCNVNYPSCKRTSSSHLLFAIPNLQDVSKTSRSPFTKHTSKNNSLMQSFITSHVSNSSQLMGVRYYCTNKQPELPKLMNFPEVVWPSVLKTIRNFILSNFIIKRYFDGEFSLPEFAEASKQVII